MTIKGLLLYGLLLTGFSEGVYASDKILLQADFQSEKWFTQFNTFKKPPKAVLDNTSRVLDPERKKYVLKVVYHPGSYDLHDGGAYWRTYLREKVEKATLSYDFKFDPTFDFVLGGKLPGLSGGGKVGSPDEFVAGGETPTGTNGWSSRLMWREKGHAENYAYYFNIPTHYGKRFEWKTGDQSIILVPGKWYHVESQVVLNEPTQENGSIRTWLDGKEVAKAEHLQFRTVDTLKIDSLHFATFFGGNSNEWAPKKDEAIYFDNFKVTQN